MSDPTPVPEPAPCEIEPVIGGLAPNIAAGLACLFSIVSGAVFLVLEGQNKFVRFWAMQSMLLGGVAIGTALLVAVAAQVLGWLPLIGWLLLLLLRFAYLVFKIGWAVIYLVCLFKAFSKEEWEVPWIGKVARQLLGQAASTPPPSA